MSLNWKDVQVGNIILWQIHRRDTLNKLNTTEVLYSAVIESDDYSLTFDDIASTCSDGMVYCYPMKFVHLINNIYETTYSFRYKLLDIIEDGTIEKCELSTKLKMSYPEHFI